MRFTKMNGAGNDFILLDGMAQPLPTETLGALAKTLCDRRMSIGADGLMAVLPAEDADFAMKFYNSDGSEGEMCGNGARCICRYGYEHGYAGQTQRVRTKAGMVSGTRRSKTEYTVRLPDVTVLETGLLLSVNKQTVRCSYVELGSPGLPHAVVQVPELQKADEAALREFASALRHHPQFPKGANVNFYELLQDGTVLLKTFERGVEDFTYACGTGTGATAAVLALAGKISPEDAAFSMRGGVLSTSMEVENGSVKNLYLTGPTAVVCTGDIAEEALQR